jgi:urease accessory protein
MCKEIADLSLVIEPWTTIPAPSRSEVAVVRVDRRLSAAVLFGAIVLLAVQASPAVAHTGQQTKGLWNGLTHPLLGPDHIFAMVTVGILAVILTRPILAPATFLSAMTTGGALAMAGMPLHFSETAIALSVVALGAALVAGQAMRPQIALGLVGLAGFVHGHAHGAEAPTAAHPTIYITGFVVATATLHLSGVGVGLGIRHRQRTRAAIGALVVGAGVGLVAGVA